MKPITKSSAWGQTKTNAPSSPRPTQAPSTKALLSATTKPTTISSSPTPSIDLPTTKSTTTTTSATKLTVAPTQPTQPTQPIQATQPSNQASQPAWMTHPILKPSSNSEPETAVVDENYDYGESTQGIPPVKPETPAKLDEPVPELSLTSSKFVTPPTPTSSTTTTEKMDFVVPTQETTTKNMTESTKTETEKPDKKKKPKNPPKAKGTSSAGKIFISSLLLLLALI